METTGPRTRDLTFHEIVLDDDERRLYGELARALQARGEPVPANLASLLDAPPLPVLAELLRARPLAALEAGTRR